MIADAHRPIGRKVLHRAGSPLPRGGDTCTHIVIAVLASCAALPRHSRDGIPGTRYSNSVVVL